ncbi:enoyl-CoA hydratase/isomerase family protein [Oceanicoccus sp. KOV_DT_Chl]|uniref:enoyl-CoA hydratase/isomerase family protein n=1 Tax=Oceanicoccus sp. KOV_DT_Chl TaxID=1904639 RepID=UPI000C7A61E5|nr:enoyl-CoA hydratase/isomerase family protein [Oceanicoccus sp. KOV_DT_Chl]
MTDNSTPPVLFETLATTNGKQFAIATLNEEKTLNALSIEMVDLLYSQLLDWQQDDSIVGVMLQGAGQKAFCAGGDVQKLHQSAVENPGGPCEYAESFFEREYRLDYIIHQYKKPLICWGHGIVMGGGLGLMAGCKHRVVTEKTRMAMPEITIALYPDVGGSWFLNRAPGRTGLYLALTAGSMNATDCLYVGYGDHFIQHEQKQDVLEQLLALNWSGSADSSLVDGLLAAVAMNNQSALPAANIEPHFDIIQQLTGFATLPEIVQAITEHATDDKWLSKGAAALAHGSALSACNIYQALALTKEMSLAEVFQFELMLSTNVIRHPEFAEGVRALLIDKDQQPRWLFDRVDNVPLALLEQMVSPPWPENPLNDLSGL